MFIRDLITMLEQYDENSLVFFVDEEGINYIPIDSKEESDGISINITSEF